MMKLKQVYGDSDSRALVESPLICLNATTSHLQRLGFSMKTLYNIENCGLIDSGHSIKRVCKCKTIEIQLKQRCNSRVCEYCSDRRRKRLRQAYLPILRTLPMKWGKWGYKFLTISPGNYDSYEGGVDHTIKTFRKFIRRNYIKERLKGGIYDIHARYVLKGQEYYRTEKFTGKRILCTHKKTGWNVHLHCIIWSRKLENRIYGKCLHCTNNLMKFDWEGTPYCASHKCNSNEVIITQKDSRLVREWNDSGGDWTVNMEIQHLEDHEGCMGYLLKHVGYHASDRPFATAKAMAEYMVATQNKPTIKRFGMFYKRKNTSFITRNMEKHGKRCGCCDCRVKYTSSNVDSKEEVQKLYALLTTEEYKKEKNITEEELQHLIKTGIVYEPKAGFIKEI